ARRARRPSPRPSPAGTGSRTPGCSAAAGPGRSTRRSPVSGHTRGSVPAQGGRAASAEHSYPREYLTSILLDSSFRCRVRGADRKLAGHRKLTANAKETSADQRPDGRPAGDHSPESWLRVTPSAKPPSIQTASREVPSRTKPARMAAAIIAWLSARVVIWIRCSPRTEKP